MKRIAQILFALVCTAGIAAIAAAQSAGVDKTASSKLTKHLHSHRLPMVGAQISNTESGRQLLLYGFVATEFGKQDAVTKSKAYLHDPAIAVVNNIRVKPELRHLKSPPPSAEGVGAMPPPRADWENTLDDTLRSGARRPPMIPR